jgi:hemolysin activation/secretion protein
VLAVRSVFSVGINAFGATISDTGTDGRFFSWLGQIQWIRQLTESGLQMVFRTDIQLANDSLLPMERFSIGGMNSVRGYRENQLVRDNGVASSFELRIPIIYNRQREVVVQFAPFTDVGWSWNTKKETPSPWPVNISSLGAGIRWAISRKANFVIYAGYPLRKIHNLSNDLQDEGIHFQLSWQVF